MTLQANPLLSLEEALKVVNIKRGILPKEESIAIDLHSLFGFMVWKTYLYDCARVGKSFSNDDLLLVMTIAYDYMNTVLSDSGLQHSVSESNEKAEIKEQLKPTQKQDQHQKEKDRRWPWYQGIGAIIIVALLKSCGVF